MNEQHASRTKTHNLYRIGDYKVETNKAMKTWFKYRMEELHR